MKIQIIKPVVLAGYPGTSPGDVIEVSDTEAREFVACGWVVLAREDAAPVVENREPEVENRDPKPRRKAKA